MSTEEAVSYENFDSLFEAFGDLSMGIICINRETKVCFINSMAGYFLGVQSSSILGRPINVVISDPQVFHTFSTGIPRYDIKHSVNGYQLRLNSLPIKINGQILFFMVIIQDYSENITLTNKLAELRDKYEFLETLLEETFEELGAVDKDGRITYVSRKSAQNLAVERDEVLGEDILTISKRCLLKKVASTGIPEVAKISHPNKKPVPVMVVPLFKNEKLAGAVCKSIFNNLEDAKDFIFRLQNSDNRQIKNPTLKRVKGCRFCFEDIVGNSSAILNTKTKALRTAEGDSTILITGESGTGKELFAQAIHMTSLRKKGPFIRVNCAGIPENLLESELFGYEYGSFTGARKEGKPGKFELAHNGSIFLDEVGDMSIGMQAKLLRVAQENEFERVGGTVTYEVDARIIAATNKDLWKMVKVGQFREDLYYRLDVVNIPIPPLRERLEDIPLLIEHFIPQIQKRTNSSAKGITPEVLNLFMHYDWPGNVRELINVLEGAMNLNISNLIEIPSLPLKVRKGMANVNSFRSIDSERSISTIENQNIKKPEKKTIEEALHIYGGNKRQTAIYLNMCRSTLYNKLKKYEIFSRTNDG